MNPPTDRKTLLVVHGKVAQSPPVRDAVETLRDEGARIDVRVTWEAGDGLRFAREAVDEAYDLLVAGGGDGTINELLNGLSDAGGLESGPALGIVPLGTANDLARSIGLPQDDVLAALRFAVSGTARPVDVGTVNGRCFVNVASGGIGAEITTAVPDGVKRVVGGAAYSLFGLIKAASLAPYEGRVAVDGVSIEDGPIILVGVCNGRQCGGGYLIAPEATIDDGQLDIVVVRAFDLSQLGLLLAEKPDPDAMRHVVHRRGTRLVIETDRPLQMNLDGEALRADRFECAIRPGALRMVVPDDCPLLDSADSAD